MNISSTRAHPFIWLRSRMLGNIKPIGPIGPSLCVCHSSSLYLSVFLILSLSLSLFLAHEAAKASAARDAFEAEEGGLV